MGSCKPSTNSKNQDVHQDHKERESLSEPNNLSPRARTTGIKMSCANFVQKNTESVTDIYRFGTVLGTGFHKVVIGTHRKLGQERAIKTIRKIHAAN